MHCGLPNNVEVALREVDGSGQSGRVYFSEDLNSGFNTTSTSAEMKGAAVAKGAAIFPNRCDALGTLHYRPSEFFYGGSSSSIYAYFDIAFGTLQTGDFSLAYLSERYGGAVLSCGEIPRAVPGVYPGP